jgi:hypothetical protein
MYGGHGRPAECQPRANGTVEDDRFILRSPIFTDEETEQLAAQGAG